jgi:hypothetical protein
VAKKKKAKGYGKKRKRGKKGQAGVEQKMINYKGGPTW